MVISKTPLRISFVGGGSDISDYYSRRQGRVVSTAIGQYIYFAVNPRHYSDEIHVSYSKTEWVSDVNKIKHDIIREALKFLKIKGGIDIACMSDLPASIFGSGLGSSSALTVGILNALHAFKGEHVSPETLAREACEIEIDIIKSPIGKQDQYAVAYGGFNDIKFYSDESVEIEPLLFSNGTKDRLQSKLMLFYTGLPSISGKVLPEQKRKTLNNLDIIDEMVKLAGKMSSGLKRDNIDAVGNLLHDNWMYKKKLAKKISNPIIDDYYNKAIKAGAVGGKILGSGGGGFLLFYCDEKRQAKVRLALRNLLEIPLQFETQGSRIIYSGV